MIRTLNVPAWATERELELTLNPLEQAATATPLFTWPISLIAIAVGCLAVALIAVTAN